MPLQSTGKNPRMQEKSILLHTSANYATLVNAASKYREKSKNAGKIHLITHFTARTLSKQTVTLWYTA